MELNWHDSQSESRTRDPHLYALRVDRNNGIPLYIQLRDQIKHFIKSGLWHPGYKLPTERQLSNLLGVSRNTISLAYKDLATDDLIESQQGRGTFVADNATEFGEVAEVQEDREQCLERILDEFLDNASKMGFDLSTVQRKFSAALEERRRRLARVKIAFIECNKEQLDYFSKSLELGAGVHVIPILISDLFDPQKKTKLLKSIGSADLVVTTFFHLAEVRDVLGSDAEVLGIALDPDMETMVRIAQLPRESVVGVLCSSDNFADRVKKSINKSGLDYFELIVETSDDYSAVKRLLDRTDAVVTSPGRCQEAYSSANDHTIIEFIYKPDAGSINVLEKRLLEKTRKE